ncbi:MAG: tRNA pseudouridine(65) synthase TruC [Bacteroidetes bacterium]|nr:MAG: tRNA pseudouridine(65) synthase TruC [Bacteroidota bacterium]PIE88053.1 MAG: tRNA pseudouridine(65) synthase TruC [Bacteroidota bacterium]
MQEVECCMSDARFLVVNKPPGILVHKTNMDKGSKVTLMQLIEFQLGKRVYPVHRLDKGTSGVNIFSYDGETSDYFRRAFMEGRVAKAYLAVCRGWLMEEVLVDHPVYASTLRHKLPAVTRFIPLATAEVDVAVGPYRTSRYTLVRAEPQTGRWHQIRQHLNHLRHPLIKDSRHGDYRHNRMFGERYGVQTVLLHAAEVQFDHPWKLSRVSVTARLPLFWHPVLEAMGWHSLSELQPFL